MDGKDSPKTATINDVARASGTSIATVSRVLSPSGYPVSKATRKRVLEAAEKLQYAPNLLGQMLKAKNNKSLGIIIPSFQNPFFTQLVMGIESAARQEGYSTFVFSSQRDSRIERGLISQTMQLRLSGLLLSSIDEDASSLNTLLDSGMAAAVFEAEHALDPRVIDASSRMNENGSLATRYLLELGHRSIAFLTTPLQRHNRVMVSRGFQQAMGEWGLAVEPGDVIESSYERELDDGLFEFEAGKELAEKLLAAPKRYSAVVAVNDLVACGVIHGLVKAGLRVPQDISVVGIDDIPQSAMITPPLTSVSQQSFQHGHEVCRLLIRRLEEGVPVLHQRCYRQPGIVARESTCRGPQRP